MFRIYKQYLDRMILGLLLLIEVERTQGKEYVGQALAGMANAYPDHTTPLGYALDAYLYPGSEDPSTADMLKSGLGQLTKKKGEELDLLDTVVTILGMPNPCNYLSHREVKTLRDAILTPSEHIKLRAATKEALKCTCGHVFVNGEMVTFVNGGGVPVPTCHACQRPQYVRCDYCQEMVAITTKVNTLHMKLVDCGCRAKKLEEASPTQAQTNRNAAVQAEMRRIATRARTLRNPVPAQPPTDHFGAAITMTRQTVTAAAGLGGIFDDEDE